MIVAQWGVSIPFEG